MTSALTIVSETTEHGAQLPFADYWFGVIAICVFLLLLGITWSFRHTAEKYGQRHVTGPVNPEASAAHEPGRTL